MEFSTSILGDMDCISLSLYHKFNYARQIAEKGDGDLHTCTLVSSYVSL